MKKQRILCSTFICSAILALPVTTNAAGFAVLEQNVSNLGNAYAGASSDASDASTVFFNPAGMTRLSGDSISAGIHAITPSAKFTNEGSSSLLGPISGGNGGDAGGTEVAPNVYYVTGIGDKTKFGLGINCPFCLSTEYDRDWVGRYHAVKSKISSLNINPSIAFKTDQALSVGLGMNFQYVEAELTQAVNLGGFGIPDDGFSEITGDSWGIGYNFGVLFEPSEEARVGFAYRSKVKHKLGGTADFTLPAAAQASQQISAFLADSDVTADVTLPETFALSATQKIFSQWELLGEIAYTKWSRVQELVIEFENPYKTPTEEKLKFRNTYRYSLGANFKPDNRFTYRLGVGFDEGATPNGEYRSPRVPDQDRTWLALGFGFKQNNISLDLGYAHLFIDDAFIDREGDTPTKDTLKGKYEMSVDILSAQLSYGF